MKRNKRLQLEKVAEESQVDKRGALNWVESSELGTRDQKQNNLPLKLVPGSHSIC